MKHEFRLFDNRPSRDLPHGVTLFVNGAGSDGKGGIQASIEAWNGIVVHSDRLNLIREVERKRFASAISAKVPEISVSEVKQVLLEMNVQVADRLREEEAAVEEATVPPVEGTEVLWERCSDLAADPNLLVRVGEAVEALGLIGERKIAMLIYLAGTARLLEKPVNVLTKGPSSGGKSYSLERVALLLPPSAYVNYSSVSPKYLAYTTDDLRHRIVIIYEAAGMADGIGAYIIRSLLSEGRLDLGTVDKNDSGGIEARRLTKEGPTALFTTTTKASLDPELETRALSLTITDTPEQSAKIIAGMGAAAAGSAAPLPVLTPFHALQEWLAVTGERRVVIPYGTALAALTPCRTIRIRRDFRMLLSMISACAILHQTQRKRTENGAILADLTDYTIVRELMADAFAATQQDGLTPAQRQAVEAVETLCKESPSGATGVSLTAVKERLGLDKSAAQRRLSGAVRLGYARNLESRPKQPAAYVVGDPLPEPITALPEVADLKVAWETP